MYMYCGGILSYEYVEFEANGVALSQLRLISCIDGCQTKVNHST